MTKGRLPKDRLSATLALDELTPAIPGVRDARAKMLASMGLHSVRDVLNHFPIRYMDMTRVRTSATAQIGEQCTMSGTVYEIRLKRPKARLSSVEITMVDSDGVFIVSVFNRPYLANQIVVGDELVVSGKTEFNYGFLRMTNPYIEAKTSGHVEGRIIPIHHASSKVSSTQIRGIVKGALQATEGMLDVIPANIREKRGLVSRRMAFKNVHFPKSLDEASQARKRLAYEELLLLQLFMMTEEYKRTLGAKAHKHVTNGEKMEALRSHLPFKLTDGQQKAITDLLRSMSLDRPSSRMLLGDVGTGKTIVSAFGMASAADSGTQSILCAPTEVLAKQHFDGLGPLLRNASISCALLTGSTPPADREKILDDFASGDLDVLIGTHALLEPDVVGRDISFIVIDEQQRFGVNQREALLSKGDGADSLFMTATPIPRTLALTLFGGMELSYLREKPNKGASRKTTALDSRNRGVAFDHALSELKNGHQVYIVCPLIDSADSKQDESEAKRSPIDEGEFGDIVIEDEEDLGKSSLASAKQQAEILKAHIFMDYEIGLLHGGLPSDEKASVMQDFKSGKIDVLVCSTVIEVGIDVPNATVMIIEDADRFGLSQLHQLRGRVGRGKDDSQVFLISSSKQPKALKRLQAMEKSDDGFEIARYDLSLRREGDILGNKQSGSSSLKIVNIVRDSDLVEQAHEDALEILSDDPGLESREHAGLAREIRTVFMGEHSRFGG